MVAMRQRRSDKSFMQLMGMVFVAVAVFVLLTLICDDVRGASLANRSEMQAAVYYRLEATASNNFWDSTKVQDAINRAMNFVESKAKKNILIGTITLNPDSFFYAIPSGAATEGVLRVLRANGSTGDLEALTQRDIADFGKADFEPQMIYSVVGDSLMIYKTPDVTDVLYVFSWVQTADLALPSTTIDIPLAYRRMILDMAVAECARMQGDLQTWSTIRQIITQEIYGLPEEPQSEPDQLGLEGKP